MALPLKVSPMKDLVQNFYDKAKIFSKSKTRVTLDGRILDSGEFFTHCLGKYKWFEEHISSSGIWKLSDKEKADWVRKLWSEYFSFDRSENVYTSDVFDGSNIDTTNFELVVDFHKGTETVFNNKSRSISKMHPKAYMTALSTHERKLIKDQGMKMATFSFNPYNTFDRRVIDLEGQRVVEFNCFTPPAWRCNSEGKLDLSLENLYDSKTLPKIFEEFMEHLFPDRVQRKYVYNWMYRAIFSRNETYLVLNGKKGSGKNRFCDFLGALVGGDYYRDANQRFFTEGFNSLLDKARLILLDELKVEDAKMQDRLKKYINKGQNIEKKNIDADKTIETFNSYLINNNLISDMYLVWDDRRFAVPDVTGTRLLDVWTEEKIDEFSALFEDVEFLRKVGFWIKHHGRDDSIGKFQWLSGSTFWKIVHNSLTEWQKVIVDALTSGEKEEYTVADLKQIYKRRVDAQKFPFKIQKIADFVDSYRHKGVHKLGEIEGIGENATIVPSDVYKPIDTNNDDKLWEVL